MITTLPVVTLSGVKHSAFASRETDCFTANVLIDGKKVGTVGNSGQGGGDDFWPFNLCDKLNEIAKQMPKLYPEFDNDAELLVSKLFADWRQAKDLKRALASRLLFTKADGKVYETARMEKGNLAAAVAAGDVILKTRLVGAVEILNLLPFEKALALYCAIPPTK